MQTTDILFEKIINDISESDFAIADGFFDDATLDNLRSELLHKRDRAELKQAGIGNSARFLQNEAVRSDKIFWIDNHSSYAFERTFLAQIKSLSEYLNATCFTNIRDFECHYACYEKGSFYKRHLDRFRNDDARKFSVVTYLNKDWTPEDGGSLVLYLEQQDLHVQPVWGRTVIFPSQRIEHEVMPASRERLSVTGWLK